MTELSLQDCFADFDYALESGTTAVFFRSAAGNGLLAGLSQPSLGCSTADHAKRWAGKPRPSFLHKLAVQDQPHQVLR
ncbi:hypothetical protein C8K38_11261 [Rhodococcus sp. OK611]|nr:hypothetical protein C8K38_11261 [Rhodococcus sp. OK611]SNX92000.1 hypothetical protein SAMN05447004_11261 [Rhodococcus sp. OK270]